MENQKKTSAKKSVLDKNGYIEAVGRRKTSVARVRLHAAGTKEVAPEKADQTAKEQIVINEKKLAQYFPLQNHHRVIVSPFLRSDTLGNFKVTVKVLGGGVSSQAYAIRHGIARALVSFDEELRKKLKPFGYLTRDPRMVERKKYGLKKARRAPQWSKR